MHIVKHTNKTIFEYPNNVTIQYVDGMEYTKGKVDIHITIGGESSTKGANHNQLISVTNEVRDIVEMLGARITAKHIYYGKCFVEKSSALSKLKDYMALADIIVSILNKSK
jgi:hypothetical protein